MNIPSPSRVLVVGIGADDWAGLARAVQERVLGASVLLGGARHLAMVPPVEGQERLTWPSPLRERLPALLEQYADREVVVLASGDPLVSGIGSTLVDLLGAGRVEIEPALSSVTVARARMGWSAESTVVVSLVGRDVHLVLRELAPRRRILVLSADAGTPGSLAALLTEHGAGASSLTVLGDLGSASETRHHGTAAVWDAEVPPLNVVAVEIVMEDPGRGWGWTPGLPDSAYDHDGQISKRDVRASALSRLSPRPAELLWDVGAGAGSVGIEWMRTHPTCRAVAVERDPARAARISANAHRLGAPGLQVVEGLAPGALGDLPAPDAVFVGGGATTDGVIDACLAALSPGGRLVVHGVTLETDSLLLRCHEKHGGELTRISVEHAEPLGRLTGWTPARAVTQWSLET